MIYLITGTPGAGKSLYAVSTLVQSLMNTKLKRRGQVIERRLLVDGVTGLKIPHELLTPGVEDDDGNLVPAPEGDGVWNWPEWCKPGDLIFVDEIQRWWRPRGLNTKPPAAIKALETHRHLGIDFVIVTQSPMLLDQNIRRLVYRHQHIRRLFGMQRAMVYEWDSCCADPSRVKSATMSLWNYPKKAYDLYVSSQLHTKPKSKIPPWLALPVLALIGGIVVAPMAFSTLSGAMTGKGVSSAKPPAVAQATPLTVPTSEPVKPVTLPAEPAPGAVAAASSEQSPPDPSSPTSGDSPKFSGCIASGSRCLCFNDKGRKVSAEVDMCTDLAKAKPIPSDRLPGMDLPPRSDPQELATLAKLWGPEKNPLE